MLKIAGFDMYSLGPYPCIVKGTGRITVELHEVTDEAFQVIKMMEAGAGYLEGTINLKGLSVTIFYADKGMLPKGARQIKSGDWCAG